MVDFLFAAGQALCIVGLLYGAYVSITFRPDEDVARKKTTHDPLTTHMWRAPDETMDDWSRRAAQ